MILAVDVGNTETVLGVFDDLEAQAVWRVATDRRRTPDEHRLLLEGLLGGLSQPVASQVERMIVASVVPIMDRTWRELADDRGWPHAAVTSDSTLPVQLDVEEPGSVGPDRIANTLAALTLYQRDTIVVDLGTATTFDCISAGGVFRGGVIAPGPRAGMERLGETASRLPQAEISTPDRVVGRNTRDCLSSGIFFSIVDGIDGIVKRIVEEWRPEDPVVVATGGLVHRIAPHCRTVQRVEPDLTLIGLAAADPHLR